uniref:Nucleolar protein 16 n=1 Tax=Acrobeloides nanus TaxID=290746 RepID=A0A914DYJ0_9BILA
MARSVKHGGKKQFHYRHRNSVNKNKNRSLKKKIAKPEGTLPKSVQKQVEAVAKQAGSKPSKKELKHKLLQQDKDFCTYMINKHGEDYEAMARDSKNISQNTPKQLERKISVFKRSKQREEKMEV